MNTNRINFKDIVILIVLFALKIGLYFLMGKLNIILEVKSFILVFICSLEIKLVIKNNNGKNILKIIKDKYVYDKKQHRYKYILKE